MSEVKFKRETSESLIVFTCHLGNHEVALALDTGASHTTIDLTTLQIAGYDINDATKTTYIETASGVIEAYLFKVGQLTALGITKSNIEICAYDFFTHHVLTDFDGVLGLDFIDEYKICIDFKNEIVKIN
ncbi:MAG: hypothetical protein EAZ53_13280 [Bacteroidetes bacterium]|nr:MAG: hypothetical protein EAZ53_13280 [Bacteroidota bacterium]